MECFVRFSYLVRYVVTVTLVTLPYSSSLPLFTKQPFHDKNGSTIQELCSKTLYATASWKTSP